MLRRLEERRMHMQELLKSGKHAAASSAFNRWHEVLTENKRNRNLLKKAGAK